MQLATGKRKKKATTMEVDGHMVLKSDNVRVCEVFRGLSVFVEVVRHRLSHRPRLSHIMYLVL